MKNFTLIKAALAATVALIALTGCSQFVENERTPEGNLVSRDDLIDERPQSIESALVVGGNEIEIKFSSGDCTGHHVEVEETADVVAINLSNGKIPGDRGPCLLYDITDSMLIKTKSPVGDREILDANKAQTPLTPEARQWCLDQGMTEKRLSTHSEECQSAYWTPARQAQSEQLRDEWLLEQDMPVG